MISSRTPEGDPNCCPVCSQALCLEPSTFPTRDAPCPHCSVLLNFSDPNTVCIPFAGLDVLYHVARPVEGAPLALRVDLSGVTFFDSAALGKLLTVHRKATPSGRRIVLCNVAPAVREELRITKLDRMLSIE